MSTSSSSSPQNSTTHTDALDVLQMLYPSHPQMPAADHLLLPSSKKAQRSVKRHQKVDTKQLFSLQSQQQSDRDALHNLVIQFSKKTIKPQEKSEEKSQEKSQDQRSPSLSPSSSFSPASSSSPPSEQEALTILVNELLAKK